jgi:hypothetical protein
MKHQIHLGLAEKFVAQCQRLGVTGPPAIKRAQEVLAIAEAHEAEKGTANTLEMSPTEIREFIEDRAMRRHTSVSDGTGLAPGIRAFRGRVVLDVAAAVMPQLEDVVDQLRPRFKEMSGPLVAAVTEYGFTLSTSSDDIINMEDDAATAAWRDARRAWDAIAPIVALRKQMTEVFNLRPNTDDLPGTRHMTMTPNLSVLFAASDNWSLDSGFLANSSNSLDWFELARGGLRLNSPREVDAKLKVRDDARLAAKVDAAAESAAERKAAMAGRVEFLDTAMQAGKISVAR